MQFDGKVAIVTGGGTVVGRATSRKFADAGATVVVVDRESAGATETVRSIREHGGTAEIATIDVTGRGAMEALINDVVARHGTIEFFHFNVGVLTAPDPITSLSIEEFDHIINHNVKSVFFALRHTLPVMVRQGHGSFVINCSIAALNGFANQPGYVASNHAVLGLIRGAALDVAALGVTVNAICQGAESSVAGLVPPEEIADMVLFLCSAGSRNITGAHFIIDRGQSASFGSKNYASYGE